MSNFEQNATPLHDKLLIPMTCVERQRLVGNHLKAIAEWKKTFDSTGAWDNVLEAEGAVVAHCDEHGCQEALSSSRFQSAQT